jgi:hypothetical protein
MRKFFMIWFFILLVLVSAYFLYSVIEREKKPDTIKNGAVAANDLLTQRIKWTQPCLANYFHQE